MGLFWRTGQSFTAGELRQQRLKGTSHMSYTIRKQGQGALALSSLSPVYIVQDPSPANSCYPTLIFQVALDLIS